MYTSDHFDLSPIRLPPWLTAFLWPVVLRELKQAGVRYALAECTLSPGALSGRPVQKIRFLGKDFSAFGAPPLSRAFYVYVGPEHQAFLA